MAEFQIIKEAEFAEHMDNEVADFLKHQVKDGYFTSFDRKEIHYHYCQQENAKGSVVISHGFCEFFGKYHEVCYYFHKMGYSFYMIEHRGHGYSCREIDDWSKVHVKSFDYYVKDFKLFMDRVVLPKMEEKGESKDHLYLFAHSMGGCVGTLFMEQYPDYLKKAVLSSPLMHLNYKGHKEISINALAEIAHILHWDYNYIPGARGFDGVNVFESSSAISKPRYDYQFHLRELDEHYQSYGSCYSWTRAAIHGTAKLQRNASKVKAQVLLFQAENDTMVDNRGHQQFIKKAPHVQLVFVPKSKHEIFNATDDIVENYYKQIQEFLEA